MRSPSWSSIHKRHLRKSCPKIVLDWSCQDKVWVGVGLEGRWTVEWKWEMGFVIGVRGRQVVGGWKGVGVSPLDPTGRPPGGPPFNPPKPGTPQKVSLSQPTVFLYLFRGPGGPLGPPRMGGRVPRGGRTPQKGGFLRGVWDPPKRGGFWTPRPGGVQRAHFWPPKGGSLGPLRPRGFTCRRFCEAPGRFSGVFGGVFGPPNGPPKKSENHFLWGGAKKTANY